MRIRSTLAALLALSVGLIAAPGCTRDEKRADERDEAGTMPAPAPEEGTTAPEGSTPPAGTTPPDGTVPPPETGGGITPGEDERTAFPGEEDVEGIEEDEEILIEEDDTGVTSPSPGDDERTGFPGGADEEYPGQGPGDVPDDEGNILGPAAPGTGGAGGTEEDEPLF